jgi:hypothetical protein
MNPMQVMAKGLASAREMVACTLFKNVLADF